MPGCLRTLLSSHSIECIRCRHGGSACPPQVRRRVTCSTPSCVLANPSLNNSHILLFGFLYAFSCWVDPGKHRSPSSVPEETCYVQSSELDGLCGIARLEGERRAEVSPFKHLLVPIVGVAMFVPAWLSAVGIGAGVLRHHDQLAGGNGSGHFRDSRLRRSRLVAHYSGRGRQFAYSHHHLCCSSRGFEGLGGV
jgi:hypothetical protein